MRLRGKSGGHEHTSCVGVGEPLIENYPGEFHMTLIKWAIDVSIEYLEGDIRDGLRSCIESMESTIETGDARDPTVVEEVTVARAVLDRIEREEQ